MSTDKSYQGYMYRKKNREKAKTPNDLDETEAHFKEQGIDSALIIWF